MAAALVALGLEEVAAGQVVEDSVAAAVALAVAAHLEDGSMNMSRVFNHLLHPPWLVRYKFPPATLDRIEECIKNSETQHSGEICFAVESSISFFELLQNNSSFEHGIDVFSELRIWDTAQNNGVLILLILADRKVEIVADRGLNEKITEDEWQRICQFMEKSFLQNNFEAGVVEGIHEITQLLTKHYPSKAGTTNELPNKPIII